MGIYQLGTAVTVTETFSVSGVPADPTTITYTVQDPLGVETDYVYGVDPEVTNPSVGVYVLDLPPLTQPGLWRYRIVGTGAVSAAGSGDFTILQSTLAPQDVPWPQTGPCMPWTDCEEIKACCNVNDGDDSLLDDVAVMSSELLFELSGRIYNGSCERTVRPCATVNDCWGNISPSWSGYPWSWGWESGTWGWRDGLGLHCNCKPLSRVQLPGYPVTKILEVKIDGVAISPGGYRLDQWRYLTRMRDPLDPGVPLRWPGCQILDLPDTEPGTWSVRYTAGQNPPLMGRRAATEIACEIYKSCSGQECSLPQGVTRVTRQGVTIERTFFARDSRLAVWRTGLPLVDAFLNAYNPNGLTRRPLMIVPGQRPRRYAPQTGA